ncbi:MAG: class I SAM-dependent methyltransferase [Isosphaeraceae bacterium]
MLTSIKRILKSVPILGPAMQRAAELIRKQPAFLTSAQYWEDRYRLGGNSGAGSYNRLARFKSEVLNDFVRRTQINSVIEFGCGDGAQVELAEYPRYIGVDVSITAIDMCCQRYRNDPSKTFFTTDMLPPDAAADLALSLDVIYHLVEDPVFDAYMHRLFNAARHFVAIYSSNEDNMWPAKHVRHRKFTQWIERNRPDWTLMEFIKNKYPYDPNNPNDTSFADFHIFTLSAGTVQAPH